MFGSDRFAARKLLVPVAALVALVVAGCDDPTLPRTPPDLAAMTLFLILDPDASTQPLLIKPAGLAAALEGLSGEVRRGDSLVAAVPRWLGTEANAHLPCIQRYGPIRIAPYCLDFEFRPEHGATYRVRASASTAPSAQASTTVPGPFQITEAAAQGDVPGTEGLRVRWTPSTGAYRYVVALRPSTPPSCVEIASCEQGWFIATQDTAIDERVPPGALAGSTGPWFVDVIAMDEALYQYLTTGTSGNLFPVGAVQNVNGGYGAVGSWVRRSRAL